MTGSMKQAIELLQLTTVELYERIAAELLENPLLEEEASDASREAPSREDLEQAVSRNLSGDEERPLMPLPGNDDEPVSDGLHSDAHDSSRYRDTLERVIAQDESLADHLLWQARLVAANPAEFALYQQVITSLDENGFLTGDPAEIGAADPALLARVLASIQGFDPVGCAVRDVRESLAVQARALYPEDRILGDLVERYIDELERLDYDAIARGLGIARSVVIDKGRLVQSLDPLPGRRYTRHAVRYIVPDIDVRVVDDEIIVSLEDDWLPRIRINSFYIDVLRKKSIEKNIREYIQDRLQSARSLIRNLAGRRQTILRVVRAIMEHQRPFLLRGPGHLKPLTHLDIAREIEMHESTVSRVTAGKYVQTPWGVFGLKYFFVSRLKTTLDEHDVSSEQVMSLMQDIVRQERAERPYSDGEIAAILEKSGICVARRTVAKYRGILNIPPSGTRKRIHMIKPEEHL